MSDFTKTSHEVHALLFAIQRGDFDPYIDQVYDALRQRQKLNRAVEAAINSASIQPEQMVTLHDLRPNYLNGVRARVIEVSGDKIKVDMGRKVHRYGPTVTVPASAVRA